MLGLRLDVQLCEQLAALARQSGRSKSDLAREAVRDYLVRHDQDLEFKRQVALLNIYGDDETAARGSTSEWLRLLDEEDGGYDWGPDGPPQ